MEPFSIVAPTASADGYGCSAEALILNATRHYGADIQYIEHDWRDSRFSDPEFLALRVPNNQPVTYREVLVVYFLPFALTHFRSGITVGMSMWESSRLPDSWAACGQLANAFVVPSEHSRQVFQARMSCPVEVTPFGTDTELYSVPPPQFRRSALTPPHGTHCRFLMAGMLHYRKGVEFALRALREEFTDSEPVTLTLKTRRGFLDAGSEYAMLQDPRVTVIDTDGPTDYTRTGMRDLYWFHDCLLAPSRGEGSGLTPRDAMATGLPVILTDWSGLSELADPRYSYPVSVGDFEQAPHECTSYAPGITGGGDIGCFARPSVPELRGAMREVFENPVGARMRGLAAADWMRREWTWERCAGLWLKALEKLTAPKYVSV